MAVEEPPTMDVQVCHKCGAKSTWGWDVEIKMTIRGETETYVVTFVGTCDLHKMEDLKMTFAEDFGTPDEVEGLSFNILGWTPIAKG